MPPDIPAAAAAPAGARPLLCCSTPREAPPTSHRQSPHSCLRTQRLWHDLASARSHSYKQIDEAGVPAPKPGAYACRPASCELQHLSLHCPCLRWQCGGLYARRRHPRLC
eukprot:6023566-Pleurochrysis_carterae.AAC.1